MKEKPHPDMSFEMEARASGFLCVAGVDEAGRGPLAGPVVAGAVILPVLAVFITQLTKIMGICKILMLVCIFLIVCIIYLQNLRKITKKCKIADKKCKELCCFLT